MTEAKGTIISKKQCRTGYSRSKPKRLLLVCLTDTWGGVEKNVLVRAKHLQKRGWTVGVILVENTFEDKFNDCPNVFSVPRKSHILDFRAPIMLHRIVATFKPTSLFVARKEDWFIGTACAWLNRIPKIVCYLGINRRIRNSIKYLLIFKRWRAWLLTNSQEVRQNVIQHNFFLNHLNTRVIYNGFDMPLLQDQRKESISHKTLIPEGSWVVGCAGRLSRQKGFDLLVDIVPLTDESVHVMIAGDGPEENQLRRLVNERGLASRIHFLGHVSDMSDFFTSISCFALISRNEGMANVLNEALSYGIPVISTRVPGSRELLIEGIGILVEIENVEAIADAIESYRTRRVIFDRQRARQRIATLFNLNRMIEETEQLLLSSQSR
ncbi:MAG: glycosyltransferase [Planctomycetota bacterium]|nr:MAG: glycosyltransferase [Planctomycetota bacterium]